MEKPFSLAPSPFQVITVSIVLGFLFRLPLIVLVSISSFLITNSVLGKSLSVLQPPGLMGFAVIRAQVMGNRLRCVVSNPFSTASDNLGFVLEEKNWPENCLGN